MFFVVVRSVGGGTIASMTARRENSAKSGGGSIGNFS